MDTSDGANDDWISILSELSVNHLPEGYKTINMLASEFGKTRKQLEYFLKLKVDAGLIDVVKVNIDGSNQNAYKVK